jgi:hypothetical protein
MTTETIQARRVITDLIRQTIAPCDLQEALHLLFEIEEDVKDIRLMYKTHAREIAESA